MIIYDHLRLFMNRGNLCRGLTLHFTAFSKKNLKIHVHLARAELQICIENEKIKKRRKSDTGKIANNVLDFLGNAKFVSSLHICNSAHLKCFFPKFLCVYFLSCKNLETIIKSVQKPYKWTGSIFDILIRCCLLTDYLKNT